MGDATNIPVQHIQDRTKSPKIEEVSSKSTHSAHKQQKKEEKKVVEEVLKDLVIDVKWCVADNKVASDDIYRFFTDKTASNDRIHFEPYQYVITEYIDPVQTPPAQANAIILSIDFTSYYTAIPDYNITVKCSPFKVSVSIPGFKAAALLLATSITPNDSVYNVVLPVENGSVSLRRLVCILPIDTGKSTYEGIKSGEKYLTG